MITLKQVTTMELLAAERALSNAGYHCEIDEVYLYVRTSPNSPPSRLRIKEGGWRTNVSKRSVTRLIKAKQNG